MKEDRLNILISKYLRNNCTPEERKVVEQWKLKNRSNQAHFEQMQKIEDTLSGMAFVMENETDAEWNRLKGTLNLPSEVEQEGNIRWLNLRYKKYLSLAAALAALVVIVWLVLPKFSNNTSGTAQEYSVPKGEIIEYELADGTLVKLNADSYLAVIEGFSKKERRVRLQGEAYFNVAKDPEKPFIVETGEVYTQVIGTAFNLRAYPESSQIKLSVTEGEVAFKSTVDEGLRLLANNAASYDKSSRTFQTEAFQAGAVEAWLNNGFYFKNEKLSDIFLELERRFDIKIDNQTSLNEEPYSAELEPLNSPNPLLDLIAISFDLSYTQTGNVIVIQQK